MNQKDQNQGLPLEEQIQEFLMAVILCNNLFGKSNGFMKNLGKDLSPIFKFLRRQDEWTWSLYFD